MLGGKISMAVAGRGSRACDCCGNRSKWFCAADEAYLCDKCDISVHGANALAHRHERVRLSPTGIPVRKIERGNSKYNGAFVAAEPAKGGKRRMKNSRSVPRPPRVPYELPVPAHASGEEQPSPSATLEVQTGFSNLQEVKVEVDGSSSEASDRFTAEELTGTPNLLDSTAAGIYTFDSAASPAGTVERDGSLNGRYSAVGGNYPFDSPGSPALENGTRISDFGHDFLVSDPSDSHNTNNLDLSEGTGLEENDGGEWNGCDGGAGELESCPTGGGHDLSDDDYVVNLKPLQSDPSHADFTSHATETSFTRPFKGVTGQEEWEAFQGSRVLATPVLANCSSDRLPTLRLDYVDVMKTWSDRGMPWMTENFYHGHLGPDASHAESELAGAFSSSELRLVPDAAVELFGEHNGFYEQQQHGLGLVPDLGSQGSMGITTQTNSMLASMEEQANAREARVSRYRQKRHTRLYAKKIRYEVRKVNAERRPRKKGRFVKRSSSVDEAEI